MLLRETPYVRFKPSVRPETVRFPTGYAEAATASYATFSRLREEGVIGKSVLFQVSLPTPMATGYMYVGAASRDAYLRAYERSVVEALEGILEAIPHECLSIQWDVCQEVLLFEDYFPHRPEDYKTQVFAELARLGGQRSRDGGPRLPSLLRVTRRRAPGTTTTICRKSPLMPPI